MGLVILGFVKAVRNGRTSTQMFFDSFDEISIPCNNEATMNNPLFNRTGGGGGGGEMGDAQQQAAIKSVRSSFNSGSES